MIPSKIKQEKIEMKKSQHKGWSNKITCDIWTFISNDHDIYNRIKKAVFEEHAKRMNTSIFSRRDYMVLSIATLIKEIVEEELQLNPWIENSPVWATGLVNEGIKQVDFNTMSNALINSYEFVHGQDGLL